MSPFGSGNFRVSCEAWVIPYPRLPASLLGCKTAIHCCTLFFFRASGASPTTLPCKLHQKQRNGTQIVSPLHSATDIGAVIRFLEGGVAAAPWWISITLHPAP